MLCSFITNPHAPVPTLVSVQLQQSGSARTRAISAPIIALTVAYVAAVALAMLWSGVVATPDYLLLVLAPVALALGRLGDWLRDWVPFIVLLLMWEDMRSLALRYTQSAVHWGNLRPELWLFHGQLPSLTLQNVAASLHIVPLVDNVTAVVDLLHFPSTLTLALLIWLKSRQHFLRYSAALFATALAAFAVFLLAPTAPPWYANDHGMIKGLHHVMYEVMPVHWSAYYTSLDPNPVAADPSLHSALPFLAFLALRSMRSRLAWATLVWCAVMWTSVVYLGEHYVLDAFAGVGLATMAWAGVELVYNLGARRAAIRARLVQAFVSTN